MLGFPGDLVVKNLPANPGDTGSIPDPRRSHVALEQLSLCVPQLVSLCRRAWGPQFLSPCAPTAEAYLPYSLCPATREASTVRSPRSPQLEKSPCSNDDAAPPKRNKLFKKNCWDFPGYRVVRTLCSQCRRWGFDPWSGNLDSACYTAQPRKKKPQNKQKIAAQACVRYWCTSSADGAHTSVPSALEPRAVSQLHRHRPQIFHLSCTSLELIGHRREGRSGATAAGECSEWRSGPGPVFLCGLCSSSAPRALSLRCWPLGAGSPALRMYGFFPSYTSARLLHTVLWANHPPSPININLLILRILVSLSTFVCQVHLIF